MKNFFTELKMASALIGPQREAHNKYVLDELEVGDLVEFPRGPYSHWGVYVGQYLLILCRAVHIDYIHLMEF
jgi:cell wall-associated NlpC family hydrolase